MSIERTVAGIVATVFTISMKIPQIYHSIKTKRTKDISMLLPTVFSNLILPVISSYDNLVFNTGPAPKGEADCIKSVIKVAS